MLNTRTPHNPLGSSNNIYATFGDAHIGTEASRPSADRKEHVTDSRNSMNKTNLVEHVNDGQIISKIRKCTFGKHHSCSAFVR